MTPWGANRWPPRIAGFVLLLIALILLAATESAQLRRMQAQDAQGGATVDYLAGEGAQPLAARILHVSGTPRIVDAPTDTQFGVSADTPRLMRHVQMYQWRELTAGRASPAYHLDWVDHAVDSHGFTRTAGHANPGAFPFQDKTFHAGEVRLQGLRLSAGILRAIPGDEVVPIDMHKLPPNLAASLQQSGAYLTTSASPTHPRLGDVRVRWTAVPLRRISVIGHLDGDTLRAASGEDPKVQIGERSDLDMQPDMPEPVGYLWVRRTLALLLAWAGAMLLLLESRRARRDELVGLALAVVPLAVLAGVIWLGTRNQWAIVLLVLALLAAAGAMLRLRQLNFQPRVP